MSSDAVVRAYVDSLLAGKYARPVFVNLTSEFDVAVGRLRHAGFSKPAAKALINRAVGRPGSLNAWAEQFIQQASGAKVMAP